MTGLPELLTIEEAARVIRVGRTKAYAMAREWRATGGKSGLPVVDFGHALRVPLRQLETIVGGPLTAERPGGDLPATAADLEMLKAADEALSDESASTRSEPHPLAVTAATVPDHAMSLSRSARGPSPRRIPTTDQPTLPFAS